MRGFAVCMVMAPIMAAAQSASLRCASTVRSITAEDKVPSSARRLELLKQCGALFANAPFRRSWLDSEHLDTTGWSAVLLGACHDTYCTATKSTDVTACTGSDDEWPFITRKEKDRQWRLMLPRILELELGKEAGSQLAKSFADNWANVFPLLPDPPELAPGLTIEGGPREGLQPLADRLKALRPKLVKCLGPGRLNGVFIDVGPGDPSVLAHPIADWEHIKCAREVLKNAALPKLKGTVQVKWDLSK